MIVEHFVSVRQPDKIRFVYDYLVSQIKLWVTM